MDEERREQGAEEPIRPAEEPELVPEAVSEQEARAGERGALAETWREVGEQLRELGTRLANAFRAAWGEERDPAEDEAVRKLRDDLREAADRLDRALRRVATETEPHRARAVRVTREASERTLAEARVAAVQALRTLNRQLEELVTRLEQGAERAPEGERPAASSEQPPPPKQPPPEEA